MKILFIFENAENAETIRRMVKNLYKDLEISMANTSDMAKNLAINNGPYLFYLIDVEMKNIDPSTIAKDLLEITGDKPILFLGHEKMINDRIPQDLYQSNEHNNSIFYPVNKDELKIKFDDVYKYAIKQQTQDSIEEVIPSDFIGMKIKTFYLYDSFEFDIYVEITSTRYLKIIEAGTHYTISTLHNYAKKNIRTLYIKKNEQLKYLEDETQKCLKAVILTDLESADFHVVHLRSINIIHQYLTILGLTPSMNKLVDAMLDKICDFIDKNQRLGRILENYPLHYEGTASKSLLTAYLASALSIKMGWTSKTVLKKIILSAILMDYNLADDQLSKANSLNDYRIKSLDQNELENYKNHPIKAAETSLLFTTVGSIDFIIENHHETPNRKGFPNRPAHLKLTIISGVFN